MKNTIIFSLLFAITINVNCQTIKSYSGAFEKGTAKYQYYENAKLERIYQGTFEYIRTGNLYMCDNLKQLYKITGKYINGKMNGTWELTGQNCNSKINFLNNIFVGDFYYKGELQNPGYYPNVDIIYPEIKGQFNNNGKCIGSWIIKDDKYEDTRVYQNGIKCSRIFRNIQTGEILATEQNESICNNIIDTTNYILEDLKDSRLDNNIIVKAMAFWMPSILDLNVFSRNFLYDFTMGTSSYKQLPFNILVEYKNSNIALQQQKNSLIEKFNLTVDKADKLFNNSNFTDADSVYKLCIGINSEIEEINAKITPNKYVYGWPSDGEGYKRENFIKTKQLNTTTKKNELKRIEYDVEKNKEAFNRTDLGQIKQQIKTEFNNWLQKTEFETQQEFENRIKNDYSNKLETIIKNKISNAKSSKKKIISEIAIGVYNVEMEEFPIIFNNDTIYMNIPKAYAQTFKTSFSWYNILVIPLDYQIKNNNWILSSAYIVFNNKLQEILKDYIARIIINKDNDNNVIFSCKYCPSEIQNYKMKKLNDMNYKIGNEIYFYEWNINNEKTRTTLLQTLNFSIDDLGIILPIK